MNDALREQLSLLPDYLGHHLLLTVTALGIGIGLSIPLAIATTRIRALRAPVFAITSAVQTVPSLALLALMVPLLRAIGFLPAAIALILYSMLPVVRNTVTGLENVDPDLIEAGRGLGMTPNQLLLKVQVPLAMPVIIAGIRTATVWVVGIATLSTPVGATSLGNYIFSGLQTQNHTAVFVGCVSAAALALVLDGLIRVLELGTVRRSRALLATGLAGMLLVLLGGLLPRMIDAIGTSERPRVVVGAKTFTEQYILARAIAGRLNAAGFDAQVVESLGSTVAFDGLVAGRIDAYVDYTGTIWANYMNRTEKLGADAVLSRVTDWLDREHGIACLGRLGFENTYALAMPRSRAEELGVQSIADLIPRAPNLTVGGDYEFFGRPEWSDLRQAYGIEFAETVGMDGALMYSAVATGDVDVIAAFSTDGRIAAHDLLVLDDPRHAFPPYDAVLLLGPDAARDEGLVGALEALIGAIDDDTMRRANRHIDVDDGSLEEAAAMLIADPR